MSEITIAALIMASPTAVAILALLVAMVARARALEALHVAEHSQRIALAALRSRAAAGLLTEGGDHG